MNRSTRFLVPAAVIAASVSIAGCGGVPSDDVAKIDGQTISKETFDRWVTVAAASSAAQDPTAKAAVPDPPNFTKCIAAKRKDAPKPVKGQPEQTDADFKKQCEDAYETLKTQVMQFLIRSEWLELQAKELGIEIPDAKIKAEFAKARKQAFPDNKAYAEFLQNSGQTEADLLFRQRSQLLEQRITEQVNKSSKNVSQDEIDAYYEKNKAQFVQPATRDLNVVLTKDEATAEKAKAALESGDSWATVAKEYSIDPASKKNGGKLPAVAQGSQETAFDKAIFSAQEGEVEGPVKTSLGYYVFEVTKETPKSTQSLKETQQSIRQIVASEKQQKALAAFGKGYQEKWRAKTECQKGYIVPDCNNYKAPKGQQQSPGGQQPVPQQAPQQAPQSGN
jgi:foldase protein PrsA